MSRFAKLVLSGLTALSLSFAPVPAAAAPDGEDIAKALAGLAVIGLIANAARERDKKRQSNANKAKARNPYATIERQNTSRVIEGNIRRPGERFQGVRRAVLPDRCVRIVSTARGDRTVYGARCLQRDYIYASQLPSACRLQVRTNNRVRNVYGARCLRRDGWQVVNY